jgi:hypothetical protein
MNFFTHMLGTSILFLILVPAVHGADFVQDYIKKFDTDFETELGGIVKSGAAKGTRIDEAATLIKEVGDLEEAQRRIGRLNHFHVQLHRFLTSISNAFQNLSAEQKAQVNEILSNAPYKTTLDRWITNRKEILADKLKQIQELQVQLQQKQSGGTVAASQEFKSRRSIFESPQQSEVKQRAAEQTTTPRGSVARRATAFSQPAVSAPQVQMASPIPPTSPQMSAMPQQQQVTGRRVRRAKQQEAVMPTVPAQQSMTLEQREIAAANIEYTNRALLQTLKEAQAAFSKLKSILDSEIPAEQKVQEVKTKVDAVVQALAQEALPEQVAGE